METIEIRGGQGGQRVLFGFDHKRIGEMLPPDNVVIISDRNVHRLYGKDFPPFPLIVIEPGEASKSPALIEWLTSRLLGHGIDRDGFILGIGGGVVSDIAGFMASIYMRGTGFGIVSSTLLSQVDASVGGKNGINCCGVKNVLGSFRHPEFVICDHSMLATLPDIDYRSGLSELLKAAIIRDSGLLKMIEQDSSLVNERHAPLLQSLIIRAVDVKKSIVELDFEEREGPRRLLNFGHTFGHAAEAEYGIPHGQAVAWGMLAAMDFSVQSGCLEGGVRERMEGIIRSMNLLPDIPISGPAIADKIYKDKKKSGDYLNFVFLEDAGSAMVRKIRIGEACSFIMGYPRVL